MTPRPLRIPGYIWSHPENRHRRVRAIARFAAWQIWQRTIRTPWTIRLRSSLGKPASPPRLRCYPHSTAATSVLYCGFHEYQDMHFVNDWLRPGDVFIDVGANIGVYSLLASATPGVETWAFEPSLKAHARAVENVAINGLATRVHIARAAVGARSGTARLTTDLGTMNRIVPAATEAANGSATGRETEIVDVVTLDDEIADDVRDRTAVIKIDVEGGEREVIEGAKSLLSEARPALVVEAFEPAEIRGALESVGYQPIRYDPRTRHVAAASWDDRSENNLLLVRDVDAARERLSSRQTVH